MQAYQTILKNKLSYALHTLPLLLIGFFFLFLAIKIFFANTKHSKDIKIYVYALLLFVLSLFLIGSYINDAGITCTKIYLDYKNKDYSYYEGCIYETDGGNTINKTVTIDGIDFIVSREIQQFMRKNKGEYCRVVFGSHSKYIVDYIIFEE